VTTITRHGVGEQAGYRPIGLRRPILAAILHIAAVMEVRLILFFLLLAQLGDAATFMVGEQLHGIGLESNGLAVAAYQWGGLAGVLLLKAGAILVTLFVLTLAAGRFPRLVVWGGAAATAFGLLGFSFNVTALVILAG
jgi:hypothetical protein